MSEAVSVRTRFERFPATVKGAMVFRGEDSDPHQVSVRGARAVLASGGPPRPIPVESVTVTVPPHQDVFVPFELPIADLDPGWYSFEIDVDLDGSPRSLAGDRHFFVGWPRGTMRTGTVRIDRTLEAGEVAVTVQRVQLAADATTLRLEVAPPGAVAVVLSADPGGNLPVIDSDVDPETGRGTLRAYPVPRGARTLRIALRATGSSAVVEVPLD